MLNYSAGGFGGGPNFLSKEPTKGLGIGTSMTPSGWISDFGSRADFDVSPVWRLQNLGLGNHAEVREQRALQRQAELRQVQLQDRVVTQVVQAQELVQRGTERLDITRSALLDARGQPEGPVYRSLRLNFERIRGAEGRPLEVLDSIRGLNDLGPSRGWSCGRPGWVAPPGRRPGSSAGSAPEGPASVRGYADKADRPARPVRLVLLRKSLGPNQFGSGRGRRTGGQGRAQRLSVTRGPAPTPDNQCQPA